MTCAICEHVDLAAINASLDSATIVTTVKKWPGLSARRLTRHRDECLSYVLRVRPPIVQPLARIRSRAAAPSPPPSAPIVADPSGYPSGLFAYVVRQHAATIVEVAASDPDAWVTLGIVDPFVESVPADEIAAQLPASKHADVLAALADLADEPAAVRLAVTWTPRAGGEAWVCLATYTSDADVPDEPAAYTWIAPERQAVPFPSLRDAVGLEPFCAVRLARWALDSGDDQAVGAAALVIAACGAREPRALTYALCGRGLAWFMGSEGGFDAEHHAAVGVALALWVGLAEWGQGRAEECVEAPVEVGEPVAAASEAAPRGEVVERSGGWRRPMAVRQLAAAA